MKTNVKRPSIVTHEGGKAKSITPELQLRRSVMSCMLWESEFYESGESIAKRIADMIPLIDKFIVHNIAVEARSKQNLRHVPLLIAREMAKLPLHKGIVASTLYNIIQRADELSEFVALYWKEKKQPLSGQVKKGLAKAFTKFNAYDLAKYGGNGAVKLRDVLFLSHAKPKDEEQAGVWKKLIAEELESPDTWEVELSKGKGENKKESWERLLTEKKLGAMALMRNLRNMVQASVDEKLIRDALKIAKTDRVLPFRFISAVRYAPKFEPELEDLLFKNVSGREKLSGKTIILVDVSGSMGYTLSGKTEVTRLDAACGIAMIAREICETIEVYSFSNETKLVPARRGFALMEAIKKSQQHGGTDLGEAVREMNSLQCDRLIILTDEQTSDRVPDPSIDKAYLINIASAQNGVGYGKICHIDGFSESVVEFIKEFEKINL